MINQDKISIIIPIYNGEMYIAQCLDSIIEQSYKLFEVIIVDDGSTDNSYTICHEYEQIDERVRVIHQINKGVSEARFRGVQEAVGRWICFIDADDVIGSRMLEVMMNYAMCADIICVRGQDWEGGIVSSNERDRREKYVEKVYELSGKDACMLQSNPHNPKYGVVTLLWGKIIKKEIIDRMDLNQYREIIPKNFFEDIFIMSRLFYGGGGNKVIIISDEILYFHRKNRFSISRTMNPTPYHYEQIKVGELNRDFYFSNNLQDIYYETLPNHLLLSLRIWYMSQKYENDIKRRNEIDMEVKQLYYARVPELKKSKTITFGNYIVIRFWGINTRIWKWLIGILYFGRKK